MWWGAQELLYTDLLKLFFSLLQVSVAVCNLLGISNKMLYFIVLWKRDKQHHKEELNDRRYPLHKDGRMNKGFSSQFQSYYLQEMSEENQMVQWPKHDQTTKMKSLVKAHQLSLHKKLSQSWWKL